MFHTTFIPELRFLFSLCSFKKFIVLISSMILAAIFETFSIFFVYFFIATLANPTSIYASQTLTKIYNIFSFHSIESFLIFFWNICFYLLISHEYF